jgi:hypothetical protein
LVWVKTGDLFHRQVRWADLISLRALGAPAGGELDPLVVLEAAVTVGLDGGVVNEDIRSAAVRV